MCAYNAADGRKVEIEEEKERRELSQRVKTLSVKHDPAFFHSGVLQKQRQRMRRETANAL